MSLTLPVGPQIWLMALCVTCVFPVTLSVFPVITNRVKTVYEDNAAWGETSSAVVCAHVVSKGGCCCCAPAKIKRLRALRI